VPAYYRAVWLSDAHLCSRDCHVEHLLAFIRQVRCDYLYLVGDIIDLWQLKRRWLWSQQMNNVVRSILGKAKHGTQVIYIPGNHDEGLREFPGMTFGNVHIRSRLVHTTLDERRYLVLHGDEFDAVVQYRKWLAVLGSAAYDHLVTANRIFNAVRRRMGLPYLSVSGKIKRLVKGAMVYMEDFERAAVHEARRSGVDGIICGHIHDPSVKEIDGIRYCNTGDWVENCSALVETASGAIEIVRWPPAPSAASVLAAAEPAVPEEDEELVTAGAAGIEDFTAMFGALAGRT
jgi:UDP-2,3-diacylglucosamine pyrophosphatase LpxH